MEHAVLPLRKRVGAWMQDRLDTPAKRWLTFGVLLILGLALWLRLWGIGHGLPYEVYLDEVHEIVRAFKLGAGEYDWKNFGKGGLYFLLFFEYAVLFVVWFVTGIVGNAHDFALAYFENATPFFLLGRITNALLGTATCLVIYMIARRAYNTRTALGAALVGATAYFHARWSHLICVDIGMVLALWTSVLAYSQYERTKSRRWLITAGAFGGVAIAFKLPGALVLIPLAVCILTRSDNRGAPRKMAREAMIIAISLLVALTVLAPEWTVRFSRIPAQFSQVLQGGGAAAPAPQVALEDAAKSHTILFTDPGYFSFLLQPHTIVLLFAAVFGAALGLVRRNRWDCAWIALATVFLVGMSLADRPASKHYLLPIMPALWLLGARAIETIAGRWKWTFALGLAVVIALPLSWTVKHDYELTCPDTRLLAKEWIETTVPADAKLLMDGMRYRFIQSPPLYPNKATVDRRIAEARGAENLSRGISDRTLQLYAEAMERVTARQYDLHSTIRGIMVEDLDYYVRAGYDYIVTSSKVTQLYDDATIAERFPRSVRYYEQLMTDPRFPVVWSQGPEHWKIQGPTIRIHKVLRPAPAPTTPEPSPDSSTKGT